MNLIRGEMKQQLPLAVKRRSKEASEGKQKGRKDRKEDAIDKVNTELTM